MTERSLIDEARALTPRGTVLVVDDEPSVRASVRTILEGTCRILEAEDGVEAMELLRSHDVDLVMLDQRMPGETGLDVLQRVKAFDPTIVSRDSHLLLLKPSSESRRFPQDQG